MELSDHSVRSSQHVGRNGQTDLFGGFQIYHQLEFSRLLDREIGRLGAFEDLVYVDRSTAVQIRLLGSVRQQATRFHICDVVINHWQTIYHRQLRDALSFDRDGRASQCDDGLRALFGCGPECPVEFLATAHFQRLKLQSLFSCRNSTFLPREGRTYRVRMPQDSHAREIGNDFSVQLQPHSRQIGCKGAQTGDVSTRSRKARNESLFDRITGICDYDRDSFGSLFSRLNRRPTDRDDDIDFQRNKLSRKRWKSVKLAFCKSVLNGEVLTFGVTQVAKPLMERL